MQSHIMGRVKEENTFTLEYISGCSNTLQQTEIQSNNRFFIQINAKLVRNAFGQLSNDIHRKTRGV